MSEFKVGDYVEFTEEDSDVGVVVAVVPPGLPRVRWLKNPEGIYWPYDIVKRRKK